MRGACHCGTVVFEVDTPLRDAIACHCTQCRKVSGHYWVASSVPVAAFRVLRDDGLRWFRSSEKAQRGFCKDCGSTLFWLPEEGAVFDWGPPPDHAISFSVSALDAPSGLTVAQHIYAPDAGDYYSPDGPPPAPSTSAPQLEASCLCGACAFSLPGPAGDITACHCNQCRRTSGFHSASFDADEASLHWHRKAPLAEYVTAGGGHRGFCTDCGSSLYFRAQDGDFSVEAGAIDGATGGTLVSHIFVADKGDFYTLSDGLPQFADVGQDG